MKEIIVNSSATSMYKIIILENSVSFVEEYSNTTNQGQRLQSNYCNIYISNIQNIKYTHAIETIRSKTKALPFVLSGVLFTVAIILLTLEIWIGGIASIFVAIIMIVVGLVTRKPEENSSTQSLIVEGKDKILYQKKVQLDNDKLYDIINSIREKQPKLN